MKLGEGGGLPTPQFLAMGPLWVFLVANQVGSPCPLPPVIFYLPPSCLLLLLLPSFHIFNPSSFLLEFFTDGCGFPDFSLCPFSLQCMVPICEPLFPSGESSTALVGWRTEWDKTNMVLDKGGLGGRVAAHCGNSLSWKSWKHSITKTLNPEATLRWGPEKFIKPFRGEWWGPRNIASLALITPLVLGKDIHEILVDKQPMLNLPNGHTGSLAVLLG